MRVNTQRKIIMTKFLFSTLICIALFCSSLQASETSQQYFQKGQEAMNKGLPFRAARYFEFAILEDANELSSYFALINIKISQGQYADAMVIANKGLAQDDSSAYLWADKGMVAKNLGDLETARVAYNEAVSLAPNDPEILFKAAGFFQFDGNLPKAKALSQTRKAILGQ